MGRGRAALPSQRDGGVTVAAALLLGPCGRRAPHPLHLPVLLPHKQLHHQDLLLVDLHADVFGDVWNQPVHHVTHQHHHVLREEGGGGGGDEENANINLNNSALQLLTTGCY